MSKPEELGLGGTCSLQLAGPKNTVQELKTEGIGRRDTAGDGEYCNFWNQTICIVMNMNNKSV
jgi:hypothetical protein